MIKTYTYKIKPNKKVEQKFNHWLGICRYVFNVSKELKEVSYRHGLKLSAYDIQKQLTDAKKEHTFLKEVHSNTLQAIIERLDNSFKKFFKGAGYPKWASKKRWKSIPFKSIKATHNAFKLPSFGVVKVFKFKEPKGNLKTATIIKEADGLYLKIVVDEYNSKVKNRDSQSVVALDMGIKFFTVTSDGEFVENPKHLFKYLSKLRIENRKLSRCKKGSSNFYKQVRVLQKLHLKISRTRKDFLHKISSELSMKYSDIIIENLDVLKMSKCDSKLSKHILDCAWGNFFEMLEYKTNVHRINPAYTSQTCSKCGYIDSQNRKTQSHFECVKCNHTENADLQAAKNILELGHQLMEANVNQ